MSGVIGGVWAVAAVKERARTARASAARNGAFDIKVLGSKVVRP
jgi:hypothetical protein